MYIEKGCLKMMEKIIDLILRWRMKRRLKKLAKNDPFIY